MSRNTLTAWLACLLIMGLVVGCGDSEVAVNPGEGDQEEGDGETGELQFGESCESGDECVSGICFNEDEDGQCTFSCQVACDFEGYICFEGICVEDSYCDESTGEGPGCDEESTGECEVACDANATCVEESDGSFQCLCDQGFDGDGTTCVEEDPCGGSCDENASCTEVTPGDFQCSCNSGYEGSGLECDAIEACAVDNGGCGDPDFFFCSADADDSATCTEIDTCATNNGDCGDPQYYTCTDGVGQSPTCDPIDACATNNGDCGDPQYYTCTDGLGQAPTCDPIDACATNNGGCGDTRFYSCSDGLGQEPTCTFTGVCDYFEVFYAELAGTYQDDNFALTNFDSDLLVGADFTIGVLRFDISDVPENILLDRASFTIKANYGQPAPGTSGAMVSYVGDRDNEWQEMDVFPGFMAPEVSQPLGELPITTQFFTDQSLIGDADYLVDIIDDRVQGTGAISFMVFGEDAEATFYGNQVSNHINDRPRMAIWSVDCADVP